MAYEQVSVKDNSFETVGGYGLYLNYVMDSVIESNKIKTAQKSGIQLTKSHRNKVKDNDLNDVCKLTTFSAIRLSDADDNTFDNDTIRLSTHTHAFYTSDGCTGNRIVTHKFDAGTSGLIGGADSTEVMNIGIGSGQTLLFNGDLSANGNVGTLSHDIRNFNFIVIVGNDNSGADAALITMTIPKLLITIGASTGRFRLIPDDSSGVDRIDFSFPTATSIQSDTIQGTCHIRKVIGVV
ncbi:hypothetical protein D3C85_1217260 [compost metagenome]